MEKVLSPEVIINVAQAYGQLIGKRPVILGGDTRVSHEMVINIVTGALNAVGTDVILMRKSYNAYCATNDSILMLKVAL